MPIYEYKVLAEDCLFCPGKFEVIQKLDEATLDACPKCGRPCQKVLSKPASQTRRADSKLDPKNLAEHGFTQYRKAGDGYYEKTAGEGPNVIQRDGNKS